MNSGWKPCASPSVFADVAVHAIGQLNARGVIPVVHRGPSREGIYLFRQEGQNIFCIAKDAKLHIREFVGLEAQVLHRSLWYGNLISFVYQDLHFFAEADRYAYSGLSLDRPGGTALCSRCLHWSPTGTEQRSSPEEKLTLSKFPPPRALRNSKSLEIIADSPNSDSCDQPYFENR